MKATLARFKAAKLLGFSGDNHYLSQAWPKSLNSKVIIELQGNNEISVDLIKAAIDGGKILKHYEETNYMACLNPTIAACDFIALLKEIGEEPSDSIKAWFESTTPQAEAVGDGGVVDDGLGVQSPDERQSQLFILIWRVHQFLNETKKPTAQEVWQEIQHRHKTHDIDGIIQEVSAQNISWCSGYGNEQNQARTTFNKTLSNIRKDPPF